MMKERNLSERLRQSGVGKPIGQQRIPRDVGRRIEQGCDGGAEILQWHMNGAELGCHPAIQSASAG